MGSGKGRSDKGSDDGCGCCISWGTAPVVCRQWSIRLSGPIATTDGRASPASPGSSRTPRATPRFPCRRGPCLGCLHGAARREYGAGSTQPDQCGTTWAACVDYCGCDVACGAASGPVGLV